MHIQSAWTLRPELDARGRGGAGGLKSCCESLEDGFSRHFLQHHLLIIQPVRKTQLAPEGTFLRCIILWRWKRTKLRQLRFRPDSAFHITTTSQLRQRFTINSWDLHWSLIIDVFIWLLLLLFFSIPVYLLVRSLDEVNEAWELGEMLALDCAAQIQIPVRTVGITLRSLSPIFRRVLVNVKLTTSTPPIRRTMLNFCSVECYFLHNI